MKNNNETEALNQAIIRLNHKRVYELQLLKEQFQIAYESLKPINIIKNTFQEVASSPTVAPSATQPWAACTIFSASMEAARGSS